MKTVNVIEAIFFAALDKKDAGERAAYLDQACDGEPDLRRCVEKLLAAQPKVGEFLQAPAPGLPAAAKAAAVDHPTDERPGTILGPYKLLHEIGEGGMGTVWMAEQTKPVKRRVALKVIKPGMDSRQVLARFEAERQALALMDHPNIAKVLDAGATENSRPYFVMELVKGQPVTEFCDKNLLTTQERLDLFVSVCNAIQHAHQKGVIHRDIKPSNVLVALYDGQPVPKVIDFGVAKAVGEPLTDKTLFTRHGQVVGTFEYMSPEQANLDQLDIDTRSDVYALGVLLYELLTGTTPLDKDRLRQAGLAEVLRLIREEEPPKPSTRLTSSHGLLATAAAYRKTDSQKLPRAVRGELDWIVMKALDKDRNRRFPTANGLAADVERFLKGEPVQACPPTLGYRFRKYARKHKVALAAGTAVAAALLVGLGLTSWQAVRATNAKRDTATALDDALRLGKELDTRLGEIKAANEKVHREQAERRADQYAWDMQALPAMWEAGNAGEARRMLERQPLDLRGFEWRYWNRQTHTEAASFTLPDAEDPNRTRGTGGLRDAGWAFSPEGGRVAHFSVPISFQTRRNDDRATLKVWDVATRKLLLTQTFAEDESSSSIPDFTLTLSHDGKVVLVGGTLVANEGPDPNLRDRGIGRPNKGWVRVLAVDSGKLLFDSRKEPSEGRVSERAYLSRDGRRLVTRETFNPETRPVISRCKVWDLAAAEQKPLTIEGAVIAGFSPDGSRIHGVELVDRERKTKIWDATTGKELAGFDDFLSPAVYSPDGTRLAGVTVDNSEPTETEVRPKRKLKVFDAGNGKEVFGFDLTLSGQTNSVRPVVLFTPDNSQVAVSRTTVRGDASNARTEWLVFEAGTGKILRTFDDPVIGLTFLFGRRAPVLFSDEGSRLIHVVDNVIHTMDPATGRLVHTLRGNVNAPSDMIALPGGGLRTIEAGGTIREWDLRPVEPVWTAFTEARVGPAGRLERTHVSADGAWVATLHTATAENEAVETVRVWDAAGKGSTELTPPPRVSPPRGSQSARTIHLSADGKRAALFRADAPSGGLPVDEAKIDPTAYPPPDVTVWDVASRKVLFHREIRRNEVALLSNRLAAFSPDGTMLALAERSTDGEKRVAKLTLLDIAADGAGKTIEVAGGIGWASFSPDGKRLQCGMGTRSGAQIMICDTVTGNRVCTIEGDPLAWWARRAPETGTGIPKSWSPDGTRLAVAEPSTARIHLFDTATGKLVKTLDAPNRGGILSPDAALAFSPDGRRLACVVMQRMGPAATVIVLDSESGKELLSLPTLARGGTRGGSLHFSPDGHRLLYFDRQLYSDRLPDFGSEPVFAGPSGALPTGTKSCVRVTTWDATPLPEPKQP
jgi:serine/threonine protein kinase/WD40 repeat protein